MPDDRPIRNIKAPNMIIATDLQGLVKAGLSEGAARAVMKAMPLNAANRATEVRNGEETQATHAAPEAYIIASYIDNNARLNRRNQSNSRIMVFKAVPETVTYNTDAEPSERRRVNVDLAKVITNANARPGEVSDVSSDLVLPPLVYEFNARNRTIQADFAPVAQQLFRAIDSGNVAVSMQQALTSFRDQKYTPVDNPDQSVVRVPTFSAPLPDHDDGKVQGV